MYVLCERKRTELFMVRWKQNFFLFIFFFYFDCFVFLCFAVCIMPYKCWALGAAIIHIFDEEGKMTAIANRRIVNLTCWCGVDICTDKIDASTIGQTRDERNGPNELNIDEMKLLVPHACGDVFSRKWNDDLYDAMQTNILARACTHTACATSKWAADNAMHDANDWAHIHRLLLSKMHRKRWSATYIANDVAIGVIEIRSEAKVRHCDFCRRDADDIDRRIGQQRSNC